MQWAATVDVEPGDHQVRVRATGRERRGADRRRARRGPRRRDRLAHDRLHGRSDQTTMTRGDGAFMNDFSGRTGAALVVGGSGGLGLPIARMLAKRGSHVAVTYRADAAGGGAAVTAAREWGARASAYQLDADLRRGRRRRWSTTVVEEYGGLHTLVYAAGPHVPMVHLSNVAPTTMAAQLAADAAGLLQRRAPRAAAPASRPGLHRRRDDRRHGPLPRPRRPVGRHPRARSRRWSARSRPRRAGSACASTPSGPGC